MFRLDIGGRLMLASAARNIPPQKANPQLTSHLTPRGHLFTHPPDNRTHTLPMLVIWYACSNKHKSYLHPNPTIDNQNFAQFISVHR